MEAKRPKCSCRKSHCLQRYCECFSQMWYCSPNCECTNCRDTEENEDEVEEQAELILKNKPDAFMSKISHDTTVDAQHPNLGEEPWTHAKGCTCRKSKCSKMYCECFKNNVGCTAKCQCEGCSNRFGIKGSDSNTGLESFGDNGNSNGTAGIEEQDILWSTEEINQVDSLVHFGDFRNLVPPVEESDDGGLEKMMLQFPTKDSFPPDVQLPTQQHGFVPGDQFPNLNTNLMHTGSFKHRKL